MQTRRIRLAGEINARQIGVRIGTGQKLVPATLPKIARLRAMLDSAGYPQVRIEVDGNVSFDYAGCLECGTCRIACEGTIVRKWENPQPTMGVEYRFG